MPISLLALVDNFHGSPYMSIRELLQIMELKNICQVLIQSLIMFSAPVMRES
jgi:hypothetical protein